MILRQTNNPFSRRAQAHQVQVKSKVKNMILRFLLCQGDCAQNDKDNSSLYYNILWWLHEKVQNNSPNFGNKETCCCIYTMHHVTLLSSSRHFWQKNITVIPFHPTCQICHPLTLLYSSPKLKIKLKGRRFDMTEMIQEEMLMVLNTLRECDFLNSFAKMVELLKLMSALWKGNTLSQKEFEYIVASVSKI